MKKRPNTDIRQSFWPPVWHCVGRSFGGVLFCLIIFSCDRQDVDSVQTIGIVPFGNFNADDARLVQGALMQEFICKVIALPREKMPNHFFINLKSPRYRADSIVAFLHRTKPDSLDLIIGLTNEDISVTKRDDDGSIKKPIHSIPISAFLAMVMCLHQAQ